MPDYNVERFSPVRARAMAENELMDIEQANRRNALLESAARRQEQQFAMEMQDREAQKQQALLAQHTDWIKNAIVTARRNPQVIPALVGEAKQRGLLPPEVQTLTPDDIETLAMQYGVAPRETPPQMQITEGPFGSRIVQQGGRFQVVEPPKPAGAVDDPAPSYRDIIDPTNPKQMITVDGRVYRSGGIGAPGVLGVAGKEPTAAKAEETRGSGRETVEGIIGMLRMAYQDLDKLGGITSTKRSGPANLSASASASGVGQMFGRAFGTKEQSLRNQIIQIRPRLLSAIMQATGMSARQLDSNAELKLWLSASTDPTLDIEANLSALDNISKIYGSGDGTAQSPATRLTPPSAPKKSAADYLHEAQQ